MGRVGASLFDESFAGNRPTAAATSSYMKTSPNSNIFGVSSTGARPGKRMRDASPGSGGRVSSWPDKFRPDTSMTTTSPGTLGLWSHAASNPDITASPHRQPRSGAYSSAYANPMDGRATSPRQAHALQLEAKRLNGELERKALEIETLRAEQDATRKARQSEQMTLREAKKRAQDRVHALETENNKLLEINRTLERSVDERVAQEHRRTVTLEEEIKTLRQSRDAISVEANRKFFEMQSQINELQHRSEELATLYAQRENELQSSAGKVTLVEQHAQELERQLVEQMAQNEAAQASAAAAQGIRNHHQYIASLEGKISDLERDSARLVTVDVENRELVARIRALEELESANEQLLIELAMMKTEKARWTTFLESNEQTQLDGPEALAKKIASQKLKIDRMIEQQTSLMDDLKRYESLIETCDSQVAQLKNEARRKDYEIEQNRRSIDRIEQSKGLLQKEIAFLKLAVEKPGDEARINDLEQLVGMQKVRICELESELARNSTELVQCHNAIAERTTTENRFTDDETIDLGDVTIAARSVSSMAEKYREKCQGK